MSTEGTQTAKAETERRVKFRVAIRTDVGLKRTENQDAYGVLHTPKASLFVVADGMGGARGGAVASALAVNVITAGAANEEGEVSEHLLSKAINLSNNVIFSKSQADSELAGMGTTVVALLVSDDLALVAHVGDSRIYMHRAGLLMRLTRDHTLVQELVDTGAIPEEDAASHPIAHMLTRSLGPTDAVEASIHQLPEPAQPGDKFVLCSDGLYNHVDHDEIEQILNNFTVDDAAAELIKLALNGGGSDNVTVEVIEVVSQKDASVDFQYPEQGSVRRELSSEFDLKELNDLIAASKQKQETPTQHVNGSAVDGANGSYHIRLEKGAPADPGEATATNPTVSEGTSSAMLSGDGHRPFPWLQIAMSMGIVGAVGFAGFMLIVKGSSGAVMPTDPLNGVPSKVATQPSVNPSNGTLLVRESTSGSTNSATEATAGTQAVKMPDVNSEDLRTIFEEDASQPLLPPPVEPEPLSDEMARVIALAADIALPPVPHVQVKTSSGKSLANQPIIWEHENRLIQKALDAGEQRGLTRAVVVVPPAALLRTDEEKRELSEEKEKLRSQIADVDVKLDLLSLEQREGVNARLGRLNQELARTSEAMERVKGRLDNAGDALNAWVSLRKKSADIPLLKLAADVAARSSVVRDRRERFTQASRNYAAAVNRWRNDPADQQAASMMAALGRETNSRRAELEAGLEKAIQDGIDESRQAIGETKYFIASLARRQSQLNRHIGFLNAFIPLTPQRRADELKKLLDDRATLVKKHTELQGRLSDDIEIAFRRATAGGESK